jgi:hypothetical protein
LVIEDVYSCTGIPDSLPSDIAPLHQQAHQLLLADPAVGDELMSAQNVLEKLQFNSVHSKLLTIT